MTRLAGCTLGRLRRWRRLLARLSPPRPRVSEHTDAARLEATRDAIRTGTAPRPRVEGEAAWLTMDEHEAQGYDLPKRAVGSKSHWLAMADRWTVEAKAQRAELARLTAEVEDWRNREAAVCPEDFGFEEVIASRDKQIAALTAEVERLRGVMEGEIEWLDGEAMRSREQEEAEARLLGVSPSTAPMVHFFNRKDKLRAALALPTPAPEARKDG